MARLHKNENEDNKVLKGMNQIDTLSVRKCICVAYSVQQPARNARLMAQMEAKTEHSFIYVRVQDKYIESPFILLLIPSC